MLDLDFQLKLFFKKMRISPKPSPLYLIYTHSSYNFTSMAVKNKNVERNDCE